MRLSAPSPVITSNPLLLPLHQVDPGGAALPAAPPDTADLQLLAGRRPRGRDLLHVITGSVTGGLAADCWLECDSFFCLWVIG